MLCQGPVPLFSIPIFSQKREMDRHRPNFTWAKPKSGKPYFGQPTTNFSHPYNSADFRSKSKNYKNKAGGKPAKAQGWGRIADAQFPKGATWPSKNYQSKHSGTKSNFGWKCFSAQTAESNHGPAAKSKVLPRVPATQQPKAPNNTTEVIFIIFIKFAWFLVMLKLEFHFFDKLGQRIRC